VKSPFGIAPFAVLMVLLTLPLTHPAVAQEPAAPPTQKILLDTDIGDDIDDAYALALIVSLPNAKLLGVTTTFGETHKRAELAAKLLHVFGRNDVPVYAGRVGPAKMGRQYEWAQGFRSPSLKSGEAALFLKNTIDKNPGEVTLVGIGALTNIGDLLTHYPEVKPKIKRIVIMGGAVYLGYNNQAPPVVEWNIKCDPSAAKIVYGSGVPLVMAGLEVTTMMQFDGERQKRLFAAGTPMTDALAALTNIWGGNTPTQFDCVAAAYALGYSFSDKEERHVEVDNNGLTRITDGPPNVTVLIHPQKEAFLDWFGASLKKNQKKVP
jgi:purine nucleosidase